MLMSANGRHRRRCNSSCHLRCAVTGAAGEWVTGREEAVAAQAIALLDTAGHSQGQTPQPSLGQSEQGRPRSSSEAVHLDCVVLGDGAPLNITLGNHLRPFASPQERIGGVDREGFSQFLLTVHCPPSDNSTGHKWAWTPWSADAEQSDLVTADHLHLTLPASHCGTPHIHSPSHYSPLSIHLLLFPSIPLGDDVHLLPFVAVSPPPVCFVLFLVHLWVVHW
jgi:hypothetical protein